MPSLGAVIAAIFISCTVSAVFTVLALDNATGGTLLHPAMPAVYDLIKSLMQVCLARFLDRMEEFYNLLWWASFPALVASIIWAIPATKWEALGIAISIPFQVVLHFIQTRSAFRRQAINAILELQDRLEEFESGTVLSAKVEEHFVTKEDAEALTDELNEATSMIDHLEKRNTELQDDLESIQKSHKISEQCKREKEQKAEISRWEHLVREKENENKALQLQVKTWKHECDLHESSTSPQVVSQLQDKIEELENKLQTIEEGMQSLGEENGDLRTKAFGNERKAARLTEVTELIHEMSTSSEMWRRFAATISAGAMADRGLNLAEFGIDQTRLQTYIQWASDLISNNASALSPTEGFRGPVLLLTDDGEDVPQVGTLNL